ncbi:Histone-lysine N-methyltransferase, H3 lysine-9 specific protein [Melia azedarach]|uniref:Histone-lysine N-methyltransferase, H3 lysine-9 specific protein n=1 Tax=Melia azedarach TaxID=155640 RepID=A0ACC1X5U2_MELAZ|nr:Histone-lysine N-methyltransferase, H3 lysine-9 specific protein [Melia azedarach]
MSSLNPLANEQDKGFKGSLRDPKRPKVSAFGTFAKVCGPLTREVDDNAVRKFPKGRGSLAREIDYHHQAKPLERTTALPSSAPRKYPPRRILKGISVKRDFPDGCGKQNLVQSKFSLAVKIKSVVDVKRKPMVKVKNKSSQIVNHKQSEVDFQRIKVKEILNLFQEVFYKLMEEQAAKETLKCLMKAARILRRNGKWINTSKRLGSIPGVKVGDKFKWMSELNVIGLHHQFFSGIDYMKVGRKLLATSIVDAGRYANETESCDILIYVGQGGNPQVAKGQIGDQKLERGNLALKNSMEAKTPVRVISKISKSYYDVNGRKIDSANVMYVYDGLFFVDKYWREVGPYGKLVFKFMLKRTLGQTHCGSLENMSEKVGMYQNEMPLLMYR